MSISFEQVEELKKRANISYEEAKLLLEKHNGSMVDALIELEKRKKIKPPADHTGKYFSRLKRLFAEGNRTKFVVTKGGEIVANVPVNYLLLVLIMGFHLAVFSLVLIFITGCKMSIKKSEGKVMDVDDVIVDVSRKVKNAAKNFTQEEAFTNTAESNSGEDGYSEFTVE